jgi:hypothetical protein
VNRYVFIFEYERDWMIAMYKNGNDYIYYNSAENDWDKSISHVDDFLSSGGNKYYYAVPNYETIMNIDIFELEDKPIIELEDYLQK